MLDVDVRRNGYGRQIDSFVARGTVRLPEDLELPGEPLPANDGAEFRPRAERIWTRRSFDDAGYPERPDAARKSACAALKEQDSARQELAAARGVPPETPPESADSLGSADTPAVATASGTRPAAARIETEFVFIRAPVITRVGADVEVLARCEGLPVLVRQGRLLGASFHPELAADGLVERLFLAMVERVRA
ncbi:MAG: hypothetical protein GF330_10305 [Candidatus Eisenbacteria bacterium]|nr:hypothetical protein [Candidatus Eisenbacteria bacterium]